MVAPVLAFDARNRMVYLPKLSSGRAWVNFWTGETNAGNQTISFDAPITHLPLNVPQGSIVVMGPFLQYTTEKPLNPLEVRVYTGGNSWCVGLLWAYSCGVDGCSSFEMYEDDGVTRDYVLNGAFSSYDICWDDSSSTVTVSSREGSYDGYVKVR
jgi:alpha-D-xyloside xylohydrolase